MLATERLPLFTQRSRTARLGTTYSPALPLRNFSLMVPGTGRPVLGFWKDCIAGAIGGF